MVRDKHISIMAIAVGVALGCAAALSPRTSAAANPQYTFAMITHGQPGDTFWDIIRKGAEAAAAKDNVEADLSRQPDRLGRGAARRQRRSSSMSTGSR